VLLRILRDSGGSLKEVLLLFLSPSFGSAEDRQPSGDYLSSRANTGSIPERDVIELT